LVSVQNEIRALLPKIQTVLDFGSKIQAPAKAGGRA